MKLNNEFEPIRTWADQRGIYKAGTIESQYAKLIEEVGELGAAIFTDQGKIKQADGVGDCVVVLTNIAHMLSLKIEDCIVHAYREIKDRKGHMSGGTFVKT